MMWFLHNFSKGKTRMYTHSLPHQADDWSSHAFVGGDMNEMFGAKNYQKQSNLNNTVNVEEK